MTQGAVKPQRSDSVQAPSPASWTTQKPIEIGDWGQGASAPGIQRKFLAGTTLDCPIATATVRHVSFPRHTGGDPVFADSGGKKHHINDARRNGAHRWGGFAMLNEVQYRATVRDIFDASLVKGGGITEDGVVKWLRKVNDARDGGNWRIVSRYSPMWQGKGQQPGDLPLGCFLYLIPYDELDFRLVENAEHPTIIARPPGFVT